MAGEHFFTQMMVQPSYGRHRCLVRWKIRPGLEKADFFVYKSKDGTPGSWELLNEAPVRGAMSYEDDLMIAGQKLVSFYYRVLAEFDGKEYDSPIVGTFEKLPVDEYKGAHRLIQLEYMRMSTGRNGVQVLHYKPKTLGTPCPSMDPDTKQLFENNDPNQDPALDCYGQRFIGGYNPPVQTWMEFQNVGPMTASDSDNLPAEARDVKVRMLAFPEPGPEDLIIHPATDNRYLVDNITQGFYFRGLTAIAYETSLKLLHRKDPRYRVPVSALGPDPRQIKL